MKPNIKVDMTVGTLLNMTAAQLTSLQNNVLQEGRWETFNEPTLRVAGGDYLGVYLSDGFFIGVEKDGYAHS